jgi:hypothetical protein
LHTGFSKLGAQAKSFSLFGLSWLSTFEAQTVTASSTFYPFSSVFVEAVARPEVWEAA